MMGLGPFCPHGAEELKESNILGNSILDENSKPFDDPDCGSFVINSLRFADLLEAKFIDYHDFQPNLLSLYLRDEPCTT
jgi:hypothetical protein